MERTIFHIACTAAERRERGYTRFLNEAIDLLRQAYKDNHASGAILRLKFIAEDPPTKEAERGS